MRISQKQILYALPAVPLAAMGIVFLVFLPKLYVDSFGTALGFVSAAVLVTRVFDAVLDPLIGYLSDRTSSRLGRRKVWMIFATLPLCVSFFLLCAPGLISSVLSAQAAFIVLSCLLFLAYSAFWVPYETLGAELSSDYDERTVLMSYREGGLVVGTVLAASVPALLEAFSWSPGNQALLCGILFPALLCAATSLSLLLPSEPQRKSSGVNSLATFVCSIREILGNDAFRTLLIAFVISGVGAALPASLIMFYVEYVLESGSGAFYLLAYFLSGLVCLPLWVGLSKYLDKKHTWVLALFCNTGAFFFTYFLSAGDESLYLLLVVISGSGFAASLALPASMQADVIHLDESQYGSGRQAQLIGVWSIARKLAAAIGASAGFWWLGIVGYESGLAPSSTVEEWIRVLYTLVPCVCNVLSVYFVLQFPISKDTYVQLLGKNHA